MKKERAIAAIKELPQNFELEELLEKLIFVDKVEKGLRQLEEGKTIDHDKVKQSVKDW
ncbi:MAG: hypothetical protein ACOC12_07350 [Bacteroidota bacterium]